MRAALKSVFCLDVKGDFSDWVPADPDFGINLMLFIGEEDDDGSDAFDLFLCTPRWFAHQPLKFKFTYLKNYLFVEKYEYTALVKHLEEKCRLSSGNSWPDLASKIDEWASWEFKYLWERQSDKWIKVKKPFNDCAG